MTFEPKTFDWQTAGPSEQQVADALADMLARERTFLVEINVDMPPAVRRAKEEQAHTTQRTREVAHATWQGIANDDRLLGPKAADYFAYVDIRNELERELAGTPIGPKREELKAIIECLVVGPRPITPSLVGVPERLTRMLYERGIMPKAGAAHIFEGRHGRASRRLTSALSASRGTGMSRGETIAGFART